MATSFIKIFLLLLIISPIDLSNAGCATTDLQVHIINKLPEQSILPLQIHCESKDDDLGIHNLAINEDYNWRFCEAFSERTLYFCRFRWGIKYKRIDVFNDDYTCLHGLEYPNLLNYCKWEVRSEGFYLEQYNSTTDQYFMTYIFEWH